MSARTTHPTGRLPRKGPYKENPAAEACAPASPQPAYRIVLYHDGEACRAEVPELPGCMATGPNFPNVLKSVRKAISNWIEGELQSGSSASHAVAAQKVLATLHCFSQLSKGKARSGRLLSPVKARLIEKFGNRSNRALAECIGVIAADAPIMLSAAMAGNGTRKVRCAIAVALNEPPSRLWPDRSADMNRLDDALYYSLKR
jgi:predicted RNase H-like HicB family nuclease